MKKLLLVLLTVCLIFAFAACNNASPDEPQLTGFAPADLFLSGKYYIEYTAYNSLDMVFTARVAKDGADMDSITAMGISSRAMLKDGMIYTIDDSSMTYTVTPLALVSGFYPAGVIEFDALEHIGGGHAPIPGLEDVDTESYDYMEYAYAPDATVCFYTVDGELYAMTMPLDGLSTALLVNEVSAEIPADMLTVPEGYTEVAR